ncbi:hypothetical protein GCM10010170_059780 [Dactylosporangium salmoneum]|uniref:Uncharacterized protein n=1 Tax=Dactylosporangium salmoneum TaxID=53361 RepID=A0ABP5TWQ7_9ACTN
MEIACGPHPNRTVVIVREGAEAIRRCGGVAGLKYPQVSEHPFGPCPDRSLAHRVIVPNGAHAGVAGSRRHRALRLRRKATVI